MTATRSGKRQLKFGVPKDRIIVFPWGVNLQDFTPGEDGGLRSRLGWKKGREFVLISVRSWEPIYGVDVVVKGFSLAAKKLPNLRLILLGGGSQEVMLKDMLASDRILDKVYFGGQVGYKELPVHYRAADLYVSASHSDGSSVSLMESLASGTPALVSSIPGNLEWVEQGRQGWIFADGDAADLADRIVWAENHAHELPAMAKAAQYPGRGTGGLEQEFRAHDGRVQEGHLD